MNFARDVVDAAPPGRLALVELSRDRARREWRFGEVADASARLAGVLAARGVGRGDVVMTLIGNRPEWVLTMVACFRIGAVALPCTEQLRAADLAFRIEIANPRLIVVDARDTAELATAAPECEVLVIGEDDLTAAEPVAAVDLAGDDPCLITFTSGTSGAPKAAVHGQRYLTGQRLQAEHWLDARRGDLVWCTAASGWSKSARNVFVAPWLLGAAALMHDARFDPGERLDLVVREGVSVLCMAPTEYRVIANRTRLRALAGLRGLVAAGEALDPEVLGAWHDATGVWIRDGYGQTETGQLTGMPVGDPARPGSMGRALPGVQVAIVDSELVVAPASVPTFFLGYLGEDAVDRRAGGPWPTGDRVRLEEDGFLYFEGRGDDVIISAGYRIGPFEVESALVAHEAVAEAAVVATPDAERGAVVRAVVVLRDGFTASDALPARCRSTSRRGRRPTSIRASSTSQPSSPRRRAARCGARSCGRPTDVVFESDTTATIWRTLAVHRQAPLIPTLVSRRLLLAAACCAVALASAAGTAVAAPPVSVPCRSAEAVVKPPAGTQCSTVAAPLDHSGGVPGTVSLAVARVPATGAKTGTLVILAGGPGQAAVPLAGPLTRVLGTASEHYDLLYVDQRGTGNSDPVTCSTSFASASIERCAEALGVRRPFWTTRETASDLEDIRIAFGDEKLTLFGVSYGAKVAGEYARRFPTRTAGLILDSPAPVDGLDTSLELRQLGLPRVLREVCFPPSCASFLRSPTAALGTLVRRLQREPLRGRTVLLSGRTRAARLTAADVYGLVLLSDLDPILRAQLPAAIASGVLKDPAPLLRLVAAVIRSQSQPAADPGINQARLLATSCVEGRLPWEPDSPVAGREQALERAIAAAPAGAFAPFGATTVLQSSVAAACLAWPPTPEPQGVALQGPDVPVLVLAGRNDLRTPLEDARRTAAQYPRARLLAVPGVGHSVLGSDPSDCASAGVTAFLAGEPVKDCTPSRSTTVVRAPFVPADLADLRPLAGVTGPAGRVATAAMVTLREVTSAFQLGGAANFANAPRVRVPGLRGGSATLSELVLVLQSFQVIRGVEISGRIGDRAGRVTVTAPGGITGVLRTGRGDKVSGTLGGERVTFELD